MIYKVLYSKVTLSSGVPKAESLEDFEKKVAYYLQNGYKLSGGISVIIDTTYKGYASVCYYQAVYSEFSIHIKDMY